MAFKMYHGIKGEGRDICIFWHIDRVGNNTTKIYAYWDSDAAQKAVAEML